MDDMKRRVLAELDSRIRRLEAHRDDTPAVTGNQYEGLNQALSTAIQQNKRMVYYLLLCCMQFN